MKVIIAGDRDFTNYAFLKAKVYYLLANSGGIEIVSGCCRGVDKLGERYAEEYGYPLKKFPANWSLGKKAGPIRNRQMAEYATHLIAFLKRGSKGTTSMIEIATELKLNIRVVNI